MFEFIEDVLDIVFNVDPRYRRRAGRLPLASGESDGYLWDGAQWVYDPEATPEEIKRFQPSA